MEIIVRVKAPSMYAPICNNAELFCALVQSRTLDDSNLEMIKRLGFSINKKGVDDAKNNSVPIEYRGGQGRDVSPHT